MHQERSNEGNETELQSDRDENEIAATASASTSGVSLMAPNQQQTAEILKLDIDCCEEVFDYLPLTDLISIGKTCKRLNQVAGYILHQNYPGTSTRCTYDRVLLRDNLNIDHFVQFIRKIHICGFYNLERFWYIQSECHRLRRIDIDFLNLTEPQIDCLKTAFRTLEILRLDNTDVDGDFHKKVLQFCPKIKQLSIMQDDENAPVLIGNGNEWLHNLYPTLEHFVCNNIVITELKAFLELNKNIRKLSVNEKYIRAHARSLSSADIHLDELEIEIESIDKEFVHQLNTLFDGGFYQRLKLYIFTEISDEEMDQIASLNGLVMFSMEPGHLDGDIQLSNLSSLEDLSIVKSIQISDLSTLPSNLPNLERIQFSTASTDDILAFIRKSVNLEKIKINALEHGIHFSTADNVINLDKLNEEREGLDGAQKIIFYVQEDIYLATKWTLHQTDFSLIQLRHIESFEWDHSFTCLY